MQAACSHDVPAPCYGKYYFAGSNPTLSHPERPRKPKSFIPVRSNQCFPAHATNIRTRGAHEFYNMMWDPSVYRGPTEKPFYQAEVDRCRKRKELSENVKRRKYPRKPKLLGGIVRPTLTVQENHQSEQRRLDDMGIQTDQYLEELTSDVTKKDATCQVEGDVANQIEYKLSTFMTGKAQECQTDKNLSYPFQVHAKGVQRELSKKVLEQSLIETTEELEVEAVRIEKRKYIQKRCEELQRLADYVERQHVTNERRVHAVEKAQHEFSLESEAERRVAASLFSVGCIGGLLNSTVQTLKSEGFMPEAASSELALTMNPYLNEAMRMYYAGRKIVSKKLLDEMLRNATNVREGQHGTQTALDANQIAKIIEDEARGPIDVEDSLSELTSRNLIFGESSMDLASSLQLSSTVRQSQNRYKPTV